MYFIEKTKSFDIIHIEQKNIKVSLLNYGATIKQIQTPNQLGEYEDMLMAYENNTDYINNTIYLNATIGPVAGRIKNGLISTKNRDFHFTKNQDQKHTLHSGALSLAYKYFDYEISDSNHKTSIKMSYKTTAFEQVNYHIVVTYTIFDGNCQIDYDTISNQDFFFSLTNHAYFNLSGNLSSGISNHLVQIMTSKRHDLDQDQVPTNTIIDEALYDFTQAKPLKKRLIALKEHPYQGYDDLYMFESSEDKDIKIRAIVIEPDTKRRLSVLSDYGHMIFYTHNNVNTLALKHLNSHPQHYGLCFECQKAPYGFLKDQFVEANTHDKHTIIFKFDLLK